MKNLLIINIIILIVLFTSALYLKPIYNKLQRVSAVTTQKFMQTESINTNDLNRFKKLWKAKEYEKKIYIKAVFAGWVSFVVYLIISSTYILLLFAKNKKTLKT